MDNTVFRSDVTLCLEPTFFSQNTSFGPKSTHGYLYTTSGPLLLFLFVLFIRTGVNCLGQEGVQYTVFRSDVTLCLEPTFFSQNTHLDLFWTHGSLICSSVALPSLLILFFIRLGDQWRSEGVDNAYFWLNETLCLEPVFFEEKLVFWSFGTHGYLYTPPGTSVPYFYLCCCSYRKEHSYSQTHIGPCPGGHSLFFINLGLCVWNLILSRKTTFFHQNHLRLPNMLHRHSLPFLFIVIFIYRTQSWL